MSGGLEARRRGEERRAGMAVERSDCEPPNPLLPIYVFQEVLPFLPPPPPSGSPPLSAFQCVVAARR